MFLFGLSNLGKIEIVHVLFCTPLWNLILAKQNIMRTIQLYFSNFILCRKGERYLANFLDQFRHFNFNHMMSDETGWKIKKKSILLQEINSLYSIIEILLQNLKAHYGNFYTKILQTLFSFISWYVPTVNPHIVRSNEEKNVLKLHNI